MTKSFAVLLLIGISFSGYAQMVWSHFENNKAFYNPAATAEENQTKINTAYRWNQALYPSKRYFNLIHDSPFNPHIQRHCLMEVSSPLSIRGNSNFKAGILFFNQKFQYGRYTDFRFNFAYSIPIKKNQLSMGLTFNRSWTEADYTSLHLLHTNPKTNVQNNNWGSGFLYQSAKRGFYLGASAQLLAPVDLFKDSVVSYGEPRSVHVISGINFKLSQNWNLQPAFLLVNHRFKANNYTSLIYNMSVLYQNRYLLGFGYSTGTDAGNFRLGYQSKSIVLKAAYNSFPYGLNFGHAHQNVEFSLALLLSKKTKDKV